MLIKAAIQSFTYGNQTLEIWVPENPENFAHIHSPYWAKVWPASIGLCKFLETHTGFIKNKKVLELAAGLGLPGLFAASFASHVCLSDIEPQAIVLLEKSVLHNNLNNVHCKIIDWTDIKKIGTPDIVLLSDVNYEPASFTSLLNSLAYLLNKQCTIILSTPQRLMAKEFITAVLPYCIQQNEVLVEKSLPISIFVLRKNT
jgi:predicted nicotinamide N-methyase